MQTLAAASTVELSRPNPNFNGGMGVGPDNLPFLDNASNIALLGAQTFAEITRATPGTSIVDVWPNDSSRNSIANPDFNRSGPVTWDNRPFLDNASMMALLGPQPAAPAAQLNGVPVSVPTPTTATSAVAAVTAKLGNLSKTEWIAIAVLGLALLA